MAAVFTQKANSRESALDAARQMILSETDTEFCSKSVGHAATLGNMVRRHFRSRPFVRLNELFCVGNGDSDSNV